MYHGEGYQCKILPVVIIFPHRQFINGLTILVLLVVSGFVTPAYLDKKNQLLYQSHIKEKKLLNAEVPLSTQGPYLAPGLEDLLVDLYVITALGFGD